ncbi:MAG: HAMP domain-containing histidine kinase [Bacteroidaceae bacterium]|nr:HAMP domain-containing histidine kinase [Bacteroidaceae bacterium]
MHFFYFNSRIGKYIFFAVAIILVGSSLIISNNLVKKLELEERNKMEIWAAATSELASGESHSNFDLILTIIQSNTTIPVIVADNNEIVQYSNITINNTDTARYLAHKLEDMQRNGSAIDIDLGNGEKQTLYYEDSVLLKQLSYYPYIQLLVMTLFALIAYIGLVSVKRAEQNKVWVGLSKETAHQLGTPISSLMAWVELLKINENVDPAIVNDMDKDVKRLSTIAERFSKIGSIPDKELIYINELLDETCNYMSTRISNRVKLNLHLPQDAEGTMACRALIEWVVENLCKNAVDAMEGKGEINVTLTSDNKHIYIDVSDTGKGIARKEFETIFKPGYTTKKRGWGLGLTLAKRIIEEYHKGHIFVKESEIGQGTTFRIVLNKIA